MCGDNISMVVHVCCDDISVMGACVVTILV